MKNIQGEYYPLTTEEVVKVLSKLRASEIHILLYLRTMNYEGQPLIVPVTKIASDLEISTRAVYQGLKVLSEKGLLPSWLIYNISPHVNTELKIRDRMKQELGGAVEVITVVGRVDLLTATEVIEIKEINDWKEAFGQILAYSSFFPQHKKRIHLFGRLDLSKLAIAQATVADFDITVTFEEV